MVRDVDVNETLAVMQLHDEDQQDGAREGRDREEIDRHQRQGVIRQKGAPRL